MELIGVKEIMELCGIGRKRAVHLISECPYTLGRDKGCTYKVSRQSFEKWLNSGGNL